VKCHALRIGQHTTKRDFEVALRRGKKAIGIKKQSIEMLLLWIGFILPFMCSSQYNKVEQLKKKTHTHTPDDLSSR
jgi:hypothetical protein